MKKYWIFFGILVASIIIVILGKSSYNSHRKDKAIKLKLRRMSLSIQLSKHQEAKMLVLEKRRLGELDDKKHEMKANPKNLTTALKAINNSYQIEIDKMLDSTQKVRYKKYQMALARKKLRKDMLKKILNKPGVRN